MSPVCNPTVGIVLAVDRRDLTALVEAITELNGPASASVGAVGAGTSRCLSSSWQDWAFWTIAEYS